MKNKLKNKKTNKNEDLIQVKQNIGEWNDKRLVKY